MDQVGETSRIAVNGRYGNTADRVRDYDAVVVRRDTEILNWRDHDTEVVVLRLFRSQVRVATVQTQALCIAIAGIPFGVIRSRSTERIALSHRARARSGQEVRGV